MEEILQLQAKLAQVQQEKPSNFSERVAVEILQKLIKNNYIQVIYTRDGNEYITPHNLVTRIQKLVLKHHKVQIIQLPDLLNINIEDNKLEHYINQALKQDKQIMKLNNQLITQQYLSKLAQQIYDQLLIKGILSIQSLSINYNINQLFLQKVIQEQIEAGFMERAIIQQGNLVSQEYNRNYEAVLVGAIVAIIKPVSITFIQKVIDEDDLDKLTKVIDQLISQGRIKGKIQNKLFIPDKFVQNQKQIIDKFLIQNNYIEYDLLEKQLYIQKPKEYLKTYHSYEQLVFLRKVVFVKKGLENLKEQVQELLNNEGHIDIVMSRLLPSCLDADDIEIIINQEMKLADSCQIQDSMIFQKVFINKCVDSYSKEIKQFIYDLQTQKQRPTIEQDNENEQINKKNKKTGKKKDKEKQTIQKQQSQSQGQSKVINRDKVIQHLIDKNILQRDVVDDDFFQDCLYTVIEKELVQAYTKIQQDLQESKKSISTNFVFELQKAIEHDIVGLQIYLKTYNQMYKDLEIEQNQTDYLNRINQNLCNTIFQNILLLLSKKYQREINDDMIDPNYLDDVKQNKSIIKYLQIGNYFYLKDKCCFQGMIHYKPILKALSQEQYKRIIDGFPKDTRAVLWILKEQLSEFNFGQFVQSLIEHQEYLLIKSVLDKKSEKNYVSVFKNSTKYNYQNQTLKNNQDEEILVAIVLLLSIEGWIVYSGNETANDLGLLFGMYIQKGNDKEIQIELQKYSKYCLSQLEKSHEILLTDSETRTYKDNIQSLLKSKTKL